MEPSPWHSHVNHVVQAFKHASPEQQRKKLERSTIDPVLLPLIGPWCGRIKWAWAFILARLSELLKHNSGSFPFKNNRTFRIIVSFHGGYYRNRATAKYK